MVGAPKRESNNMVATTANAAPLAKSAPFRSKSNKSKLVEPSEGEVLDEALTEPTQPIQEIDIEPTPGPLQVFTPTGKLVKSNEKTVIACLADLSKKVDTVTSIPVKLNKGDAQQFLDRYKHNRPLSKVNLTKIARRFSNGDFLRDYPTLGFDSNGLPCNGGHTCKGFIDSTLTEWTFHTTLGIDPLMGPRTDTNKGRDLIDQTYYVADFEPEGIGSKRDQRTFTSAVAQLFSMQVACGVIDIGMQPSEAKKEVIQHPVGQKFLEMCKEPYLTVREMLEEQAEEDDSINDMKRVVFFVPAIALHLAGFAHWPEKIAVGDNMGKTDPLFKANKFLMQALKEENNPERIEYTTRREQSETLHTVYALLAFAYCKANKLPKIKLPLPRWRRVTDSPGESDRLEYAYDTYSRKQKAADTLYRLEVGRFFLSKIKLTV